MNLQYYRRAKKEELLYVNFNQDYTNLLIGTNDGFAIFACESFSKLYEQSQGGGIGIAEMLFNTSLVAIVGAGDQPTLSPRRLTILDTTAKKVIKEEYFASSILSVKMNRKRVVVVMETKIHIYSINNMEELFTLDTQSNPEGICALCAAEESIIAYPGSSGEVLLFDALHLCAKKVDEQAHKDHISSLVFNHEGTLLATASEKGTIIRVFAVREQEFTKVYEFRRGTYPAQIYHLSFSHDSTYLTVTSTSDTIHIFKLDKTQMIQATTESSGYFSAYLPTAVSSLWQQRAFALVRIPADCATICAILRDNETIITASAEGTVTTYRIDKEGGECKLLNIYPLFETPTEEVQATYLED
eukprot:TRINITY_DN5548_c0_g1_i1.p1 TRINITY_DN5548_c0_g1~~TRINITY_DN5548_c0_g1_i1.p1  ORF type:complete len:358 (+),score=58.28 TRINITY_DN5548_c0_g1_i1:230-1303(+)